MNYKISNNQIHNYIDLLCLIKIILFDCIITSLSSCVVYQP